MPQIVGPSPPSQSPDHRESHWLKYGTGGMAAAATPAAEIINIRSAHTMRIDRKRVFEWNVWVSLFITITFAVLIATPPPHIKLIEHVPAHRLKSDLLYHPHFTVDTPHLTAGSVRRRLRPALLP